MSSTAMTPSIRWYRLNRPGIRTVPNGTDFGLGDRAQAFGVIVIPAQVGTALEGLCDILNEVGFLAAAMLLVRD